MNSLRLCVNAARSNNILGAFVSKQYNNTGVLKHAAENYSTAAAVFIRNTTTTDVQRPSTFITSFDCRNCGSAQLLARQLGLSANIAATTFWCGSQSRRGFNSKNNPQQANKSDTKSAAVTEAEADLFGESSKLGLFARFKLMYKRYWYVLIPVHVVTSAGWIGGFYYLSQSGVDLPALLQYLHLSETIIEKVQGSSLGHWAITYLCYKVVTPLRYAVTVGGTTLSIKYLVQHGYIKPMPTKAQIMQMYEDKKAQRAADKAKDK